MTPHRIHRLLETLQWPRHVADGPWIQKECPCCTDKERTKYSHFQYKQRQITSNTKNNKIISLTKYLELERLIRDTFR